MRQNQQFSVGTVVRVPCLPSGNILKEEIDFVNKPHLLKHCILMEFSFINGHTFIILSPPLDTVIRR
jgi:hypothetical protein